MEKKKKHSEISLRKLLFANGVDIVKQSENCTFYKNALFL